MTPTLDAFINRLARLTAETDWAIEKERGAIWALQAQKGMLKSGSTLRLFAAVICEKTRELARTSSADIARLHIDHQGDAFDALITSVVQVSLRAQSNDRIRVVTDSPDALRQFRKIVSDGVKTTTGLLRDLHQGFDAAL